MAIKMKETPYSCQEDLKNKNLLIIASAYPSNDRSIMGLFVKEQVAELKKHFNKVFIIAPVFRSYGLLKKDRICHGYTYDNVEVYYPRCFYIPIFWIRRMIIDNRLLVVERIIEERKLKFDLIHSHFTWPSGYIGVRLKETYGKPIIITVHENGEWFDQEIQMNHPLLNETWSKANALIRVSKKDIPALQRFNKQVYMIPNGFSPNLYYIDQDDARNQLGLPKNVKIIFAVGGIFKRKGFNYLIDAIEKICLERSDILCYIGGEGPELQILQRQIDRLHLGKNVSLLGLLPSSQLTLWMNACDLFVLPSLRESFGIVQIEALACGKPVVATRNGGSEDVIISDDYGFLVEPANSDDLGEKILESLDREWNRDIILAYAERFTWRNIVEEILNLYHNQLE